MDYRKKFDKVKPLNTPARFLEFLEDLNLLEWKEVVREIVREDYDRWSFLSKKGNRDMALNFSVYTQLLSPKYYKLIGEAIYSNFLNEQNEGFMLKLIRLSDLTGGHLPLDFIQDSYHHSKYSEVIIEKLLMLYSKVQVENKSVDRFWIDNFLNMSSHERYFVPLFLTLAKREPVNAMVAIAGHHNYDYRKLWSHIYGIMENCDLSELDKMKKMNLPSDVVDLLNEEWRRKNIEITLKEGEFEFNRGSMFERLVHVPDAIEQLIGELRDN